MTEPAIPRAAPEPEAAPTKRRNRVTVSVPSVWRESGYLVLAYKVWADEIYYFSTLSGEHSAGIDAFVERMSCSMEHINPHHLALNLLGRLRTGTLEMRTRTQKVIAAMLSVEELAKLPGDKLAEEYKRIIGHGPAVIPEEDKEARIKEMVTQAQNEVARSNGSKAPVKRKAKAPKAKTVKAKKEKTAPKEKAAKKTKTTKPKAAKTEGGPKSVNGSNPFREGSMKAKGFDFFLKNKDPDKAAKVIEHMEKLGAAPASARGWLQTFRKAISK